MRSAGFVIHLERAVRRRRQAERLAATLPVDTELLVAVDGSRLSSDERKAVYRRRLHRPRYPFALSGNEIACFLSHRQAWKAILERDLDGALIAEDDVEVDTERFAAVWSEVVASATADDFVRFPALGARRGGRDVSASPVARLTEPFLPGLGMQMQYVGREAARKLLAATETFDRPVDSMVQMQWLHGARVLSARPVVVREIDFELGGTVLQRRRCPLPRSCSTKCAGHSFDTRFAV